MIQTVIGWSVPLVFFLIGVRILVSGNKRGYFFIAFAIGVGIAIQWNNKVQQNTEVAINALKSTGFTVDAQLPSQPPVVFDHEQQKIAFVKVNESKTYSYNQVRTIEWSSTNNTGWNNKSAPEKSYSVTFHLQDGAQFSVRMTNVDDTMMKTWREKLGPPINF